jgi:superfamily I DNA/RNA helicase
MRDITERSKHPAVVSYLSSMNLRGETDYTGLLHWLLENTDSLFIKHLLVDEAQDNDDLQWRIVERVMDCGANVFCVMDPRQQIYEWRGGTYRPGLALRDHLYLTQSWRLSPEIAELSNRLAEMGVNVPLRPIVGMRESREIERGVEMIRLASLDDAAILCRTNRTVEGVCQELDNMEIEYSTIQRKPKQLTALIQYLASGIKPTTDILESVIFPDLRGGEQVARLKADIFREEYPDPVDMLYAIQFDDQEHQDEIDWWARLARSGHSLNSIAQLGAIHPYETEATSGITVSTIHQAKGLEYDTVIVPEEDYVGSRPEHYRLSLVQVTRAKSRLIVCGTEGHLVRELAKLQDAT